MGPCAPGLCSSQREGLGFRAIGYDFGSSFRVYGFGVLKVFFKARVLGFRAIGLSTATCSKIPTVHLEACFVNRQLPHEGFLEKLLSLTAGTPVMRMTIAMISHDGSDGDDDDYDDECAGQHQRKQRGQNAALRPQAASD